MLITYNELKHSLALSVLEAPQFTVTILLCEVCRDHELFFVRTYLDTAIMKKTRVNTDGVILH